MVRPALPRAFFKGLPEQVNEVWGGDCCSAKRFQARRLLLRVG
jgi:hypothetical protein